MNEPKQGAVYTHVSGEKTVALLTRVRHDYPQWCYLVLDDIVAASVGQTWIVSESILHHRYVRVA